MHLGVAYGFYTGGGLLVPRLAGDTVFLDTPSGSVRGRLGEWIELGGISTSASREASGIGSAGRSSREASRSVWLKVEALD